jgi:hypothetical protein
MIHLWNKGWADPAAQLESFFTSIQPPLEFGAVSVPWRRIDIPELFWSHTATLMILGGTQLQRFFHDCYIDAPDIVIGPFVLLRGEMSKPYLPVQSMTDVVLAQVPEDLPVDFTTLFGALMSVFLKA